MGTYLAEITVHRDYALGSEVGTHASMQLPPNKMLRHLNPRSGVLHTCGLLPRRPPTQRGNSTMYFGFVISMV